MVPFDTIKNKKQFVFSCAWQAHNVRCWSRHDPRNNMRDLFWFRNDTTKLPFPVNVKMVRLCKCFLFGIMSFGHFDFFARFTIKFAIIMKYVFPVIRCQIVKGICIHYLSNFEVFIRNVEQFNFWTSCW